MDFSMAYHQSAYNERKLASKMVIEKQRAATETRNNETDFEQRLLTFQQKAVHAELLVQQASNDRGIMLNN